MLLRPYTDVRQWPLSFIRPRNVFRLRRIPDRRYCSRPGTSGAYAIRPYTDVRQWPMTFVRPRNVFRLRRMPVGRYCFLPGTWGAYAFAPLHGCPTAVPDVRSPPKCFPIRAPDAHSLLSETILWADDTHSPLKCFPTGAADTRALLSECPIGAAGAQTPSKWFPTGRLFAQTPPKWFPMGRLFARTPLSDTPTGVPDAKRLPERPSDGCFRPSGAPRGTIFGGAGHFVARDGE